MKKDFMAVILGSDENAYGFARCFYEEYGFKPIALATGVLEVTKYTKIMDIIVDDRLHDGEHFASTLENLGKKLKKEYKKLILIPCSDFYMEMLVKYQARLKDYENEFITYDRLKAFNDKVSFYKMCDKYNILYPKTYICTPKTYKDVLKKVDLTYPVILKPNNSNSEEYLTSHFEGKEKVFFIDSYSELEAKIKTIYSSTYQDSLIIQKYVTGDDTNMRVLNVYVDRRGKVKVMSLGRPILEEYHPQTYGNYAAIVSMTKHISIMDDIKRFLEEIGYRGTANFDIKKDEKTGEYYVFEINPRPGRSSFFTACAGKSIASCYVEDLVYESMDDFVETKKEILWLNVPFSLVKKYVKNDNALKKALELKKANKYFHTLKYDKDNSLKRKLICKLQYARKLHYYPKYYIEKK